MSLDGKHVVLVGHCGPDSFMLTHAVRSAVPGAHVSLNTEEKHLWESPADLLLVNRVLDGWYEDDSGMRLIRQARERGVPAMLISNFAEAQAEAEQVGASPGFGKSEVRSDKARRAIRSALGLEESGDADA